MLSQVVTLWIGGYLGPLERACIRSWQRQGHDVALYCYAAPDGVPDGVETRDAEQIIPQAQVIRHHTGSVALFANWFRYELQRQGLGTWLDTDAYLLAPIESRRPYLFGEFEPGRVNNGVLRLPPGSPLLSPLLDLFQEKTVPAWIGWRARAVARWRLLTTGRTGLSRMPWGSAGPLALTALARRERLLHLAEPAEVLYPVRWEDAAWVRDPSISLEQVIGPRTVSIHLWNERIKGFKHDPAPAGSFLARPQAEGAQP